MTAVHYLPVQRLREFVGSIVPRVCVGEVGGTEGGEEQSQEQVQHLVQDT